MKKILLFAVLLLTATNLIAEPIDEAQARKIAADFFSQHATRSVTGEITLEWSGTSIYDGATTRGGAEDALLYIYRRGAADGFVVIAGDSNVTPIIAYSLDTTIDTDNMADATKAILDAWCRQIKEARNSIEQVDYIGLNATRSSGALLYETALWDQTAPFNNEAPVYNGYSCYTGCVATAMSIICHYNRWPDQGVGTTPAYSYTDYGNRYRTVPANTLGRTYNYDNMRMDYSNGYTSAQGAAVAALMKDMGTSVKMNYHYTGSGAYDIDVLIAYTTYFKYSKGSKLVYRDTYTQKEWNEVLKQNLNEYGPTYYSGSSSEGGHAFVVDGYDENNYFHFNFGWSGYGNGYFLTPGIEYYLGQVAIFNLTPDKNGTSSYYDNILIYPYNSYQGITCSNTEYKDGVAFTCLIGAVINEGATSYSGEVALMHCDAEGNIKNKLRSFNVNNLDPSYLVGLGSFSVTISKIDVDDRLRLYYKRRDNNEWEWVRSIDRENAYDELILKASPTLLSQGIAIKYEKDTSKIIVYTDNAMTLELYNDDTYLGSAGIEAHYGLSYTFTEKGEYKFKMSLGSDPYELIVNI